MAIEFSKKDQQQMTTWIGGRKTYTLLYKASRDTCAATTFHSKCNNVGPTLTILYNTNNSVYGGYTSVSWKSSGNYIVDPKAFLFRLYQNGTWKPVQMTVNNNGENAIYDNASYGPTFGGHDLCTFQQTITWNGTCFPLNGSTNFGASYIMNGENYSSIANGHLQVKDIEVYLVEDKATDKPLDKPWRKPPEWDTKLLKDLKEKIEIYKPVKELKVPHARLIMIGQVGSGKSSFVNTIDSIFRGYITSQASAGNAEHSFTTVYRMYQVRNGATGKQMNFRLHDTRGLEADQGIDTHEICYLLDGHVPDRHHFNPSMPISPDTPGFVRNPELADKIHCVAFVLDGSTVDTIPEKIIERMKNLQIRINQRGIPQVVLLTKIDKICQMTGDDLSQVFYSPTVQETVDRVSNVIGLPRSHIFPTKNYESEMEPNNDVSILTLLTLQRMLDFANDYMNSYLNQPKFEKPKL